MACLNRSPLNRGKITQRIRAAERTVGSFSGLASSYAIEVMAAAHLDWILVDLEHGAGSEDQVGQAVSIAGAYGVPLLVRVEQPERIRIGKALDAGVAGVMLPRISSVQQVKEAISYTRYPPEGTRGVATYNRAIRWGLEKENLAKANKEVLTIVQIETQGALAAVEEIAALNEVDVLFVGPLDLSYALGVPLDFSSEIFTDALEKVVTACNKHGKSAGILAANTEIAKQRIAQGFTFLAVGSDSTLLADTVSSAYSEITNY